jgi:hypothetical protein
MTPAFARLPVLAIAGATGAVLLAVSGRFGYFGDELYFLASGRFHPAWGYADNPWLLPQLARLFDLLTPGSVIALRLLPMLVTVLGVVLSALIAREFGGGARAQTIAAAAFAISPQLLGTGHLLMTCTIDPFCWVLVSWLVARWVRTRDDWLLLYAGLATAVAMQAKFLIIALWLGLVIGALIAGPREIFRRPLLWVGTVITLLITIPTLLWQQHNGWPYLLMSQVVSSQVDHAWGGRLAIVPLAVLTAGAFVGGFLVFHGCYCLLRAPELRDYRLFGWACLVVTVVFLATAGRYYYFSGLYAVLFAASGTRIERRMPARWWRWVPTWPAFAVSAALALYLALPIRPDNPFTGSALVDYLPVSSIGWPQLAQTTATAYDNLPADVRAHTAVVGDTYWQASALDVFGRSDGLPRAYGTERGYWYMGRPPATTRQLLYVGSDLRSIGRFFDSVQQVGTVRLDHVDAEAANQGVPIFLCAEPRASWPQLWARMYQP